MTSLSSIRTSNGPVRDIMNESFHEHRPSFRTLLTSWEKGSKGSMYSTATHPELCKAMEKQKSIRLKEKMNNSFASSISSLNLDLIDEDDGDDDDDDCMEDCSGHQEEEQPVQATSSLENELTEQLESATVSADESEQAPEKKKRRKKRAPKFATEEFDSVYELGKEVRVFLVIWSDASQSHVYSITHATSFYVIDSLDREHTLLSKKEDTANQGTRMPSRLSTPK